MANENPDDKNTPPAAPLDPADPVDAVDSVDPPAVAGLDRRGFLDSLRKITVYAVPTAMVLAADSKAIAQSGEE